MRPFPGSVRDLDLATSSDSTYSATEDSAERGFSRLNRHQHDPATYADLGHAEELGHDEVGDIADEGRGHRG
jgi:hypothetical protein